MKSMRDLFLLLSLIVLGTLTGCNLPGELGVAEDAQSEETDTDTAVGGAGPVFLDVSTSTAELLACEGVGLSVLVQLEPHPDGVEQVQIEYRLAVEDQEAQAGWQLDALEAQNEGRYSLELASLGGQAAEALGTSVGRLELRLTAIDGAGLAMHWPADAAPFDLPILPCPPAAFAVVDYGPSSETAGYGQGCSPQSVTFSIEYEGVDQVQEAWLEYQYHAPNYNAGAVSEEFSVPVSYVGPSAEHPDADEFATVVDIGGEAQGYMDGKDGYLAWNIYTRLSDGTVYEHPLGGPPLIEIASCELGLAAEPPPTSTNEPLVLIPLATPTPLSLVLVPLELIHDSGAGVVMREGEYFDLDNGTLTANLTAGSDFQLHEGDDVYLDDYLPVNDTHVGWHGAGFPGKAGCAGTLKAVFPQTFDWPGMQDGYFCYITTEGREGWLKFNLWVSLPLNERRLEFDWTTYQ